MPSRFAVLLLFFLSGAAGLIYEVIWLRQLVLVFGSTQFAVSTILTAFMAGLAVGSLVAGRLIDHGGRPLRAYGLLEIGLGAYALLVPLLLAALVPLHAAAWRSFAPEYLTFSLLRFLGAGVVLIVPTGLMGATLPVLAKHVIAREESIGRSVGALYATNTMGAVLGAAAAGFLMLPALGTTRTNLAAAILSFTVGLAALGMERHGSRAVGAPRSPALEPERRPVADRRPTATDGTALWLWAVAGSGFAAMVYEVAWTRALTLILGSSVYAFTVMLVTFLFGLAAGAAVFARLADRGSGRFAGVGVVALMAATAVAAFVTLTLLADLPYLFARLYHAAQGRWGHVVLMQVGIAFALMLPPTCLMGGIFPLVARICSPRLAGLGRSVGHVYAASTMGTVAGAFCAGFLLIPTAGIQGSLLLAITLHLALAAALLLAPAGTARGLPARPAGRVAAAAGMAILGTAMSLGRPSWDTLVMSGGVYQYAQDMEEADLTPEGFRRFMTEDLELKYYKEGLTTSVMVVEASNDGSVMLAVNGKIDASSIIDLPTQILSGHLPVLLAAAPRRALVIGYASGITVGSVARHPLERITAVEIEPAILEASRFFDPFNGRPMEDARVNVIGSDGRNLLLVDESRYDLIVSEPSNPWMTVAANLFTREFFELGRSRLQPGGVFAQWLQIYGMSPEDLMALVRTFHAVFPHVLVFNTLLDADLVLVGSERELRFDLAELEARMAAAPVRSDLARLQVETAEDLLSYLVFGTRELPAFAGAGPLNTDDNGLIEFRAPRSLYQKTREVNVARIEAVTVSPTRYLTGWEDPRRRAGHALQLARAFARRGLWRRAREAAAAEPGLTLTEEGRKLMQEIESRSRG